MNYWSRNDTKEWIAQLENRIEDISYYLDQTFSWCEENEIEDDRIIFMCSFLTCIWVSQLRGEDISFTELMEILEIQEWECDEDKFYELDEKWLDLDHSELLTKVVEKCVDGNLLDDDDEE